jgi:signal transduction histidine kinase/DNA-binding response OmpR family regulator
MDSGKVNILLVDDRPEKLLALEVVLESLGQNIVRAHSGRDALRAVLEEEFAVILLDVNMPGMDGFETAADIRQRKSSEHIPIIFVTAFDDDMHSSRGYSLGAVDYITAPIIPDVLRTKVGVFVDLFLKTEQVKRQAEALRRRADQMQKLALASVAIHSTSSPEKLLQAVTDTARDVIGCHQAISLFVVQPGNGQRRPRTQAVTSFSDWFAPWRSRRLEVDRIATTLVARSRTAIRMTRAELLKHPDWEIVRGADMPPLHGGILAAPLLRRHGDENMGVIYVADRIEGEFTHDDEAILVQLAQMTSTAIENMLFAEERETNRIKDEFLATLSHELRTPLNAILGWTQLLRIEPLSPDANHGLDVIERNAKAQTKLIEDLLDVSRITTGKLRLSVKRISLVGITKASLDVVRPAADAKQITMDADLQAEADVVTGDGDRLQQVIWNLLANAVKFTPAGGRVRLSLSAPKSPAEPYVEIRVEDNGPGIRPEFLPYVFDRFRQADSTSTRSHGGLGIGLTVVRHVVELHGGQVRAESAGDGNGATFIVQLPRTAGAAATAPMSSSPPLEALPIACPPSVDLAGVNILVIDDEPDAREMIARVLTLAGANLTEAASAREALAAFKRARADLVISDIAMPEQDGFDLIRQLRQLPPEDGGQVPAIALTAYASEEDRRLSLSAGFQVHLTKPIQPVDIIAAAGQLTIAMKRTDSPLLDNAARTPAWENGAPQVELEVAGIPVAVQRGNGSVEGVS